jgi:hypothetical protein
MQIKCPSCQNKFDITDDVLAAELNESLREQMKLEQEQLVAQEKSKLREEMIAYNKKKDLELQAEVQHQQKMFLEQQVLAQQKLDQDFGGKIKFLEAQAIQQAEALKKAQVKEMQVLQLQQELQNKEEDTKLQIQQALIAKEQELKESIGKKATEDAEQAHKLRIKELELKLDQQKKLTEESQKKLNQGSMESQGEVMEDFIKERLMKLFPYDEIIDVKKGQKGGDLIHIIKNNLGHACGTILYESKNTSAWQNGWINKLLEDRRSLNAELGVIITKTFPAQVKSIGQQDGIWICGVKEFEGVAAMLREGVLKVFEAKKSDDNKADKMVMLYDYLNSTEFKQRWEALLEGFKRMKKSIEDQRNYAIKSFAEQDAIINNILLHGNTFIGSIKGIAGSSFDQVKLLE